MCGAKFHSSHAASPNVIIDVAYPTALAISGRRSGTSMHTNAPMIGTAMIAERIGNWSTGYRPAHTTT